jgi:hypothetical protein
VEDQLDFFLTACYSYSMDKLIWSSAVTADMVKDLNEHEISLLINALDDAVAQLCESYGAN